MILLAGLAFAGDPALDGIPIPDGVEVRIERSGAAWVVDVDGRRTTVDAPIGEVGLEAFRALVASLAADVPLVTSGSGAAARALAMVGPPAPARPVGAGVPPARPRAPTATPVEVAAPVATEAPPPPPPEPDDAVAALEPLLPPIVPPLVVAPPPAAHSGSEWSVWLGPELVLRPSIRPAAGFALGLTRGAADLGLGGRVAVRAPREVLRAEGSRLDEVLVDVGGHARPVLRLQVAGGLGAVVRRYWTSGTVVATHLVPIASGGVAVPFVVGGREVSVGSSAELDLGRTTVRSGGDPWVLSPIALRAEVRIGGPVEPGHRGRTSVP